MGNEKLYRRLLFKFRDTQGDFAPLFAAARQDSDPQATTRAAHTLRGTAGTIGARQAQAAAEKLEQACKQGEAPEIIELLLAETLAQLAPVMAGLHQLLSAEETPANQGPRPDPERIQPLVNILMDLLHESDSEAADFADKLAGELHGTPLAARMRMIREHIAAFDFDLAAEALAAISAEFKAG
jgi:HPt (histidine-containing phosphotransfer) domain-containing protein